MISKEEYVASGGSESDFILFDVDGSDTLDAAELDAKIAAKQDEKDPESSLSISVPATGAGVGLPDFDSQTWAVDVASCGSNCGFGTGASSGGISSSAWQSKPDKKTLKKLDNAVKDLQEGGKELSKTADKQLGDQKEDEEKWLKQTDKDKWLIVVEKGWAQEEVRLLNYTYYKKVGLPIEMVITSLIELQVLFICLLSHAHSCSLSHLAHYTLTLSRCSLTDTAHSGSCATLSCRCCCVQTTLATDLGSERALVITIHEILNGLWQSVFDIAKHIDQGTLSRSEDWRSMHAMTLYVQMSSSMRSFGCLTAFHNTYEKTRLGQWYPWPPIFFKLSTSYTH